MIILGDKIVPYELIQRVYEANDIQNTTANSTVLFTYDVTLMQFCSENNVQYAVEIKNIKEAIYANALGAKYIICKKNLAKTAQKVAQAYMFDSRVLAIISSNREFNEIVNDEIDGVIYKTLMKENKAWLGKINPFNKNQE